MKNSLYALATIVALNFVPTSVEATTVNLDNQGRVTDIFDLNVDGILYNVDFQFDTFQNLFGDLDNFQTEPTFWNQKDLGVTARDAINSELNALNPTPSLVYDDDKNIDLFQFYIPFEVREGSSAPIDSAFGDFFEGVWRVPDIGGVGADDAGIDSTQMYATFTVANDIESVPEPTSTLSLLVVGAVAGTALKRKQA